MSDRRHRAENMRLLHDTLIYSLTETERRSFTRILNEFQNGRDRKKFVLSLRALLISPSKQEIIPYLLAILPAREREQFLQLWMRTSNYNAVYESARKINSIPTDSRSVSRNTVNNRPYLPPDRNASSIAPQYQASQKTKSVTFSPVSTTSKNNRSHLFKERNNNVNQQKKSKARFIVLKRGKKNDGFGFSIRGGSEHALGIYVSSVEESSPAEKMQLSCGDQLLKVNKYNFQNIDHAAAVQVIQRSKKLKMFVVSSGFIPESRLAQVEYQWVDVFGNPSSPPMNFRSRERRASWMGSFDNGPIFRQNKERRVILKVHSGFKLGLKIRGGQEYGLGIYVSSVDKNRVAEKCGIRPGDQILDVNGIDFLEISHRDAVRVLKSYKMLSVMLRDVGKIPYASTVVEKTEWFEDKALSRASSLSSLNSSLSSIAPEKSKFSQGIAGSQLLHQSTTVASFRRLIEEKALMVLSTSDLATLKYYLNEYSEGGIHIEGLVLTLFHLLDTPEKTSLFDEIRSLIFPQDLDLFDRLVLEKEIESMKSSRSLQALNGDYNWSSQSDFYSPAVSSDIPIENSVKKRSNIPTQGSPMQLEDSVNEVDANVMTSSLTNGFSHSPTIVTEALVTMEATECQEEMPVIEDLSFEENESSEEHDYQEVNIIPNEDQLKHQDILDSNSSDLPSMTRDYERHFQEIKESSADDLLQNRSSILEIESDDENNSVAFNSLNSDFPRHRAESFEDNNRPDTSSSSSFTHNPDDNLDLSFMRNALHGFSDATSQSEDFSQDKVSNEVFEQEDDVLSPTDRNNHMNVDVLKTLCAEPAVSMTSSTEMQESLPMSMSYNVNDEGPINETVNSENRDTEPFPVVNIEMEESGCTEEDLEFEFEDEPENLDEKDTFAPLKFAPIRLQETPTQLTVNKATLSMSPQPDNEVDEDVFEDITAKTNNGLNSDRNRRQRYHVVDVPQNQSAICNYIQDSSSTLPYNNNQAEQSGENLPLFDYAKENETIGLESYGDIFPNMDDETFDLDIQPRSEIEASSTGQHSDEGTKWEFRGRNDSKEDSGENAVLQLPDRNLASRRFDIVNYRTKNEDDSDMAYFKHQEIGLTRPLRRLDLNDDNSQLRNGNEKNQEFLESNFRNLRSIFEHKNSISPRTEYLSEIIKKNNEEGRRRTRSSCSNTESSCKVKEYETVQAKNGIEAKEIGRCNSAGVNTVEYQSSVSESDFSSMNDFDFSSISPRLQNDIQYSAVNFDDRVDNSSGYGSEECFNGSGNKLIRIQIEKGYPEIGIVLRAKSNDKKGVEIESILEGDQYPVNRYKELKTGQEIISADGESLQGLSPQIANITLRMAYRNPSGRFLELVVKNNTT